jgi:hypothetical protein
MQDGPTPWNVKTTDMVQLQKGMKLMRHRMLGWWKNKVTRSFLSWAGVRCEEIAEVDRWANKVSGGRAKPVTKNNIEVTSQGSAYGWSVDGKEEYCTWWRKRHASVCEDLEAGADAVERAANSSWWTWDDGSRPFHWRWPPWHMKTIRDGLEVHFQSDKPTYRKPQRDSPDDDTWERMREKLDKVRKRRYICAAFVKSLTAFFAVPKQGTDDIRMVYDGTISRLNDSIWVPRFVLPTLETHLRAVDEGTYMADVDVGDCFLNFMLHPTLRELAGVDLSH